MAVNTYEFRDSTGNTGLARTDSNEGVVGAVTPLRVIYWGKGGNLNRVNKEIVTGIHDTCANCTNILDGKFPCTEGLSADNLDGVCPSWEFKG